MRTIEQPLVNSVNESSDRCDDVALSRGDICWILNRSPQGVTCASVAKAFFPSSKVRCTASTLQTCSGPQLRCSVSCHVRSGTDLTCRRVLLPRKSEGCSQLAGTPKLAPSAVLPPRQSQVGWKDSLVSSGLAAVVGKVTGHLRSHSLQLNRGRTFHRHVCRYPNFRRPAIHN